MLSRPDVISVRSNTRLDLQAGRGPKKTSRFRGFGRRRKRLSLYVAEAAVLPSLVQCKPDTHHQSGGHPLGRETGG